MPKDADHAEIILTSDGQHLSHAFLHHSRDSVTILNDAGRISFMNNHSALDITDPNAIVGIAWWQLWPQEHQENLKMAFERGLDGKITKYWGQALDCHGQRRDWDVHMTPVPNANSTISSVMVVLRDVTL